MQHLRCPLEYRNKNIYEIGHAWLRVWQCLQTNLHLKKVLYKLYSSYNLSY
jgi:hypothetical protein